MKHEHGARVAWKRDGAKFTDNRYSRGHEWSFDGGVKVPASSSPLSVPVPLSLPPPQAASAVEAASAVAWRIWVERFMWAPND